MSVSVSLFAPEEMKQMKRTEKIKCKTPACSLVDHVVCLRWWEKDSAIVLRNRHFVIV
jgi:hypothetical protein